MTPADAWSYGLLYDLRLMTGRLTLAELPPILGRASQNRSAARRGPLAIRATSPLCSTSPSDVDADD
jgi:hypothetical protein